MRVISRACEPAPAFPDLIWSPWGGMADLALTSAGDDLSADAAIATAVVMSLFSDARDADDPRAGSDPRGWWGDAYPPAEADAPLGSKLWLPLERGVLSAAVAREVETLALESLAWMIADGLVARVDAAATARPETGRLDLEVALYARDGRQVYAARFDDLWQQVR